MGLHAHSLDLADIKFVGELRDLNGRVWNGEKGRSAEFMWRTERLTGC